MIRRVALSLSGFFEIRWLVTVFALTALILIRTQDMRVQGTTNRITKFTGPSSINDSSLSDNGSTVTASTPLDMGTHQIHNVVDPTAAQDAATQAYVLAHSGASAQVVTDNVAYGTTFTNYAIPGDSGTSNPITWILNPTSGSGSSVITGVAGGFTGRMLIIRARNPSAFFQTILGQDPGSSPSNRFDNTGTAGGGANNISLSTNTGNNAHAAIFVYDGSRWVQVASSS